MFAGGYVTLHTGGVVLKGESELQNAQRKLKEELGLKIDQQDIEFIGNEKYVGDGIKVWGSIYFVKIEGPGRVGTDIHLRKDDVDKIYIMWKDDLLKEVDRQLGAHYLGERMI